MFGKRLSLVAVLAVSFSFGLSSYSAYTETQPGAGVVLPGQPAVESTADGCVTPLAAMVRYSDLELREDDTSAITDRLTNIPYNSTWTYRGPSDAEWLHIYGGTSYVVDGTDVIFYNVQGEISVTYRSREFAIRQDDTVILAVQPWATDPFDFYINIYFPPWYQLTSAEPPGYLANTGRLQWSFYNITSVSLQVDFNGTGGQRPLLDFPVDYEGRSDGSGREFSRAFNNRITSLFDHRYPDYAKDQKLLLYTGIELDDPSGVPCRFGFNCYDGHDAYDIDDRCPAQCPCSKPSAVYPAADGEIVQAGWLDNIGGCQIIIDHGNGWTTLYAHLRDSLSNHSCDGILRWSGHVSRFGQIGVIGESGSETVGTHLHFAVKYRGTLVDPSGWEPDPRVFPDPWTVQSGVTSYPMWMHSIRTTRAVSPQTGAIIPSQYYNVMVNVPACYYASELVFNLTEVPVMGTFGQLISTGHSFSLNAVDGNGNSVHQLDNELAITVQFTIEELAEIQSETLSIYVWDDTSASWAAIPTSVDLGALTATAEVNHLSLFALMGDRLHKAFLPIVSK
jgi:hypothetical protein